MGKTKQTRFVTRKEEIRLVKEGKKWELVLADMPYVADLARKRAGLGSEVEDLIQAGIIEFRQVVEKYQLGKGTRVLSYCAIRIRRAINKEIKNNGKTIRVGIRALNDIFVINFENEQSFMQRGHYLTYAELAKKTRFEIPKIKKLSAIPMESSSLDKSIALDEPGTFYDLVQDKKVDLEAELMQRELCSDVDATLRRVLNSREYQIMQSYYGLDGHKQLNLEQIGAELGITKQRVSKIKEKVFDKLKDSSDVEKLRGYVEN